MTILLHSVWSCNYETQERDVEKKGTGGEGGRKNSKRLLVNEWAKARGTICQLIPIPFRSTNSSISCIIHAYLFLIEIPWPRKEAGKRVVGLETIERLINPWTNFDYDSTIVGWGGRMRRWNAAIIRIRREATNEISIVRNLFPTSPDTRVSRLYSVYLASARMKQMEQLNW